MAQCRDLQRTYRQDRRAILQEGLEGLPRGPDSEPQIDRPVRRGKYIDRNRAAALPRRADAARFSQGGEAAKASAAARSAARELRPQLAGRAATRAGDRRRGRGRGRRGYRRRYSVLRGSSSPVNREDDGGRRRAEIYLRALPLRSENIRPDVLVGLRDVEGQS